MKKILVILSGELPIPAIKGGAVENLTNMYLDANEKDGKYEFEVYSAYSQGIEKEAEKYKYCKFHYINKKSLRYQFFRFIKVCMNRVLHIKTNYEFISEVIKDVKRNNKEKYYDLIIVENNESLIVPLREVFKQKIILHSHNDNVNIKNQFAKQIYEKCDSIYAVSNYIKTRVEEVGKKGKTHVLLNGIDTKKFSQEMEKNEREKLRKKLKIEEDDFVFLYTGRLCEEKGVKELIQAFSNVQEKIKNAKLMIVGASFYSSNKKNKYVKELIKLSEKIKDKIIFTGYVEYNEIWKYYKIADMAVMPSLWEEAAGLAMLEAYISEVPLITTRCGGIPEYISDKKACIIEKENIIKELTDTMFKIYKNYDIYKEKAKLNQEEKNKYDTDTYIKNFYKLLNEEFN